MYRVVLCGVRQALARLQALGVIAVRRGRGGGAFVLPFDHDSVEAGAARERLGPLLKDVELLLDYRSLIEEQVARTAAERRCEADIEAMKAALVSYGEASDAMASRAADHALRGALVVATANPHLARLSRDLVVAVNLGFTADPYSGDLHRRALGQHRELVAAVVAGNVEAAALAARVHFQATTVEPWRAALAQR